jgi:uncharacterized protein YidB (DUF937 family)
MSLMDDLLGSLGGALGGQAQGGGAGGSPLLQIAMSLLAGQGSGSAGAGNPMGGLGGLLAGLAGGAAGGAGANGLGGLGGLMDAFQRNGLGDVMQSWVGTGQNLPISPDQLQQVLGGDVLGRIAQQLGSTPEQASSGLADLLPRLVDGLTPQGRLPEGGVDLESIMRAMGVGRG